MNEIIDSLFYGGWKSGAVVSRAHAFIVLRPICFGAASVSVVWRRALKGADKLIWKESRKLTAKLPVFESAQANKKKNKTQPGVSFNNFPRDRVNSLKPFYLLPLVKHYNSDIVR